METDSLFLSLNIEGEKIPSKIELVPAGNIITGRDGRTWKNKNPKETALNSMARLPKLPIDENHATDLAAPKGGASPALGWITALNASDSGAITAEVEWTPRGREAVLNKEYAFISPVFLYNKEGEINCILRAALTNAPNLQLPALNSEMPEKNITEDYMDKALCDALGFAEDASLNDVLDAIEKLKTAQNAASGGGKVDLQVYAPRTELNAALEKAVAAEKRLAELCAEAFKKEATAAVDEAIKTGKFTPASRDTCLALCADKTGLEKFKELASKNHAVIDGKVQVPETAPPAGSGKTALNSEDAAMAKAMGYSEEEYLKIKGAGK
ncbi:MAG: phage protease [Treponema sp.]|jgi:phage I-like protein|nr:phage protease [Treponema sp.]